MNNQTARRDARASDPRAYGRSSSAASASAPAAARLDHSRDLANLAHQALRVGPRKIPASAIDKVARSLREFGWRQPIVVDPDGVIVVGHVRRLAAFKNGWTDASACRQ